MIRTYTPHTHASHYDNILCFDIIQIKGGGHWATASARKRKEDRSQRIGIVPNDDTHTRTLLNINDIHYRR